VGIGNPLRGDDGVGSCIAQLLAADLALRDAPPARATVIDAEEVPESYLGPIVATRPDTILLLDAAELGAAPGTVALIEADALDDRAVVTHRTPLGPLATFLHHRTGAPVLLLGIQPGPERWGDRLDVGLETAARELAGVLADILCTPAEAPLHGPAPGPEVNAS
jgi:hydrogenase 3 maturation protease